MLDDQAVNLGRLEVDAEDLVDFAIKFRLGNLAQVDLALQAQDGFFAQRRKALGAITFDKAQITAVGDDTAEVKNYSLDFRFGHKYILRYILNPVKRC